MLEQEVCYSECASAVFHFMTRGIGSGSSWAQDVQEIYCAKSFRGKFCLPTALQIKKATEPSVEMLDVSCCLAAVGKVLEL